MKHIKQVLIIAAAFLATTPAFAAEHDVKVTPGLPGIETVGEVSAQELAQTGEGRLSVAAQLFKANVKIYSRVGWELGRLTSKYDPGPYPGVSKALGLRK